MLFRHVAGRIEPDVTERPVVLTNLLNLRKTLLNEVLVEVPSALTVGPPLPLGYVQS